MGWPMITAKKDQQEARLVVLEEVPWKVHLTQPILEYMMFHHAQKKVIGTCILFSLHFVFFI